MAAALEEELMQEDLYAIVGDGKLSHASSAKEVEKAYRQKALKLHPDKNPNDKNAATKFHRFNTAYNILKDEAKRQTYDSKIKANIARKARFAADDVKMNKMRDSLDEREKASLAAQFSRKRKNEEEMTKQQNAEFVRAWLTVQKRSQSRVPAQMANYKAQLFAERQKKEAEQYAATQHAAERKSTGEGQLTVVSVTWKAAKKRKHENQGAAGSLYDEEALRKRFSVYGAIASIIVKPSKGKASIFYRDRSSADEAIKNEAGDPEFVVTLNEKATAAAATSSASSSSHHEESSTAGSSSSSTANGADSSAFESAFASNSAAASAAFGSTFSSAASSAGAGSAASNGSAAMSDELEDKEADVLALMAAQAKQRKAAAAAAAAGAASAT